MRHYALVTGAYWSFTLTDGALRMLVLLHFYRLGYSPLELAALFLLYEIAGIATNLLGGWVGARLGLGTTLFAGLALQIAALAMLAMLDAGWPRALSVAYVVAAQGVSGVAKDFTKMSAKSAVKQLAPAGAHGVLFRWVAVLTGSKNALKGAGFFLGSALLATIGFTPSLLAMAGALTVVLGLCALALPRTLGKAAGKPGIRALIVKSRNINWLSGARLFLFGARDVWFVVALPVFLYDRLGWSFTAVGGFLAAWVIGYGFMQAGAPRLAGRSPDGMSGEIIAARRWAFGLALIPAAIGLALVWPLPAQPVLIAGLAVFGLVFAVNSSLHSYLILRFSDAGQTAMDVGFYYMANAAGRLLGTVLSGLIYQFAGLTGCLAASSIMIALAWAGAMALRPMR
jgi:hypothetical protein